MNIYWGVIRIWYVSTTRECNNLWMQPCCTTGNGIVYCFDALPSNLWTIQGCLFPFFGILCVLRLCRYFATLPFFVKAHSHGQSCFLFSMRAAPWWLFHIETTSREMRRCLFARIFSKYVGRFLLADDSYWIHQEDFVSWRSRYLNFS